MFDRNDPADLAALKTEVETDPIGMGYAAVLDQTTRLLRLLNDPANNVGGETTGRAFTPRLMLEVIEPSDLTVGGQFSSGDLEWVKLLMESAESPESELEEFRSKFSNVFPANSATVDSLNAAVRTLSRGEVLFGDGTVLGREDWYAARNS